MSPRTTRTEQRATERHFAGIARHYRSVRTTDEEPIRHIAAALPERPLRILDVGAGTGRYTELLRKVLGDGTRFVAADRSQEMLQGIADGLDDGIAALRTDSGLLAVATGSIDAVTTFNAIHHFDLDAFTGEVTRVLRPDGHLFVYTRTPEQNARSIWGRLFPEFTDREDRLRDVDVLESALADIGEVDTATFTFARRATASRLAEQVRGRAYSTFSRYEDDELEDALATFLAHLGAPEATWEDGNVLLHARVRRR